MKIYLFLLTAAAVLPPTLAMDVAYIPWDVPKNDVAHVIFPMNMANTPHEDGYYFSQYFTFTGQTKAATLVPRYDAGPGMSIIHAVFSTFVPGSTTIDYEYCHPGADGGPDVSCAINFGGTYANTRFKIPKVLRGMGRWWIQLRDGRFISAHSRYQWARGLLCLRIRASLGISPHDRPEQYTCMNNCRIIL